MKRRIVCTVLLIGGLAGCCAPETPLHSPDLTLLEEIRIDYKHVGWGSTEEHFTITPSAKPGGFQLRGRYETERGASVEVDEPLSYAKVDAFITELESPAWARADGIHALTQRVDIRAVRESSHEFRSSGSRCTPDELRVLARRNLGRKAVSVLVDEHYRHRVSWTDDYPMATVQVRWRGKPAFVMSSRSQKPLMLPWDLGEPVDTPSAARENWSLPLSASLQTMLPSASQTFQRLDGVHRMEYMLAVSVVLTAHKRCDAVRAPQEG